MLRAVKIKLYPTKTQQVDFNKLLGCKRFVYNKLLDLKIKSYEEKGVSLGLAELSKYYHNTMLKDETTPWLKEQNTKVVKQGIRDLLQAYDNFFEHGKGFPQFKTKKDINTCRFPNESISNKNKFETRHISLTKNLKNIKFRCSDLNWGRLKNNKDYIKNATLTRTKSGSYFLSILIDFPNEDEFKRHKRTKKHIGIDLGVKDFIITSDGKKYDNNHFFVKQEKKIKKLQRQHSKKVKGSNNREKARKRLAKAFEKIVFQRENYIQYLSNELVKEYDLICMENLNVSGMLKNHKLAKAIQDVGLFRFKQVLKDKAQLNGKLVIEVDRWFASSKTCHNCGYVYKGLTLKEREWKCPVCGEVHDRDINAAINILNEGERLLGCRTSEITLADYPTMDDPTAEGCSLKSSGRLKQEILTPTH